MVPLAQTVSQRRVGRLEEEAFHFEFESGNRVRNLWVRPPLLVGGWRDSYLGKFYR